VHRTTDTGKHGYTSIPLAGLKSVVSVRAGKGHIALTRSDSEATFVLIGILKERIGGEEIDEREKEAEEEENI
jgi:hypothetical protein